MAHTEKLSLFRKKLIVVRRDDCRKGKFVAMTIATHNYKISNRRDLPV